MGRGQPRLRSIDSDRLDHARLRTILHQRVRDGVVLRLIWKWLNAGVLEDGSIVHPESGTTQGGVISPILANICLHEVLDQWFEHEVKPRLTSRAVLVRYADDAVLLFANEVDARRVLAVRPKRLAKYGLTLHPTKTRLTPFRRPDLKPPQGGSGSGPGVRDQHQALAAKLCGHFQYFGVIGNWRMLARFRFEVIRVWCKWLNRRSQRANMDWECMNRLLERYALPQPRIAHRLPSRDFPLVRNAGYQPRA